MLHGGDRFPIRPGVFLNRAMDDELFGSEGMLAVRQQREVFFVNASGEAEPFCQSAMPLALCSVVILPIVLFRRRELFGVIPLRLRCR